MALQCNLYVPVCIMSCLYYLQLSYQFICPTKHQGAIDITDCVKEDHSLQVMRRICDGKATCKVRSI